MADTFTLDTSGFVWLQHGQLANTYWEDLTPFAQGYIEAAFASALGSPDFWKNDGKAGYPDGVGFRHLAPETLASMLADCGRLRDEFRFPNAAATGRDIWNARQAARMSSFPPVTLYLDGAGLIRMGVGGE